MSSFLRSRFFFIYLQLVLLGLLLQVRYAKAEDGDDDAGGIVINPLDCASCSEAETEIDCADTTGTLVGIEYPCRWCKNWFGTEDAGCHNAINLWCW